MPSPSSPPTQVPNLFSFATSELSQDAALAWLLAWADPSVQADGSRLADAAPALHTVARTFLGKLLGTSTDARVADADRCVEAVRVQRQADRVDVLAVVRIAGLDKPVAVLIEDKVLAGLHGDQLRLYLEAARASDTYSAVVAVYLKTHDAAPLSEAESAGWAALGRADLLAVLRSSPDGEVRNDIFVAFREHLVQIERDTGAFETLAPDTWTDAAWRGFYTALDRETRERGVPGGRWGKVPNASGGFWAFWWPVADVSGGWVYLQMEGRAARDGTSARGSALASAALTFRVRCTTKTPAARHAFRGLWHDLVQRAAADAGLSVKRPTRFGNGATMTVALLPDDPRGDDGLAAAERAAGLVAEAWRVAVAASASAPPDPVSP